MLHSSETQLREVCPTSARRAIRGGRDMTGAMSQFITERRCCAAMSEMVGSLITAPICSITIISTSDGNPRCALVKFG